MTKRQIYHWDPLVPQPKIPLVMIEPLLLPSNAIRNIGTSEHLQKIHGTFRRNPTWLENLWDSSAMTGATKDGGPI
jgi:hypothetical protein